MADDTVSYEEATEERAAEELGDPEPEEENDPDIPSSPLEQVWENVEDISEVVPDFLTPGEGLGEQETPNLGGRRGEFGVSLDISGLSQMDTRGLLEVMARVNIAQLATLFDIADAVEPFTTVTVSGTNAIDNADVEQPVVPQSDTSDIPTRTLFIRASPDNNRLIYFGDDEVQPNSGFALAAGEFIVLETDLRGEELWMASEQAGGTVQLLGMV